MGYEYELLKRLANNLELELEIKVVHDIDEMIEMLNRGEGDLIAYNLTVTKQRTELVSFAHHHTTTRQVLVQKKPDNWRKMKLHQIEKGLINSPIELIGKDIYVVRGSSYIERLQNLSEEIGADLNIIEAPLGTSTEDLIKMVANGEIELTVEDENVAKLQRHQYPIIDVSMAISLPQRIAWAVRKKSPLLLEAINEWLLKMKKKTEYYVIYEKYFESRKSFRRRINSDYFSLTGGSISVYDDLIKEYSVSLDWDWRLLASLIYQESQFHPDKTSWAGARGLMQLMPATAKQFGVNNITNVHQNVKAGVKYLNWLTNYWKEEIADSTERIKFVMSSYNIGPGHIVDARNLAEKYGANPNLWFDNVEVYLLKKSNPKFYNDSIVKYGYAKGTETVKYVREIFIRYEHYKQFIE
ncbi:MAG: transporter substrate-binding domain-containing protein [Melioribacteraceae bacterium]|nr:transporter substrate-binding domain-containing protein [Melioribacteraceae bacterium]